MRKYKVVTKNLDWYGLSEGATIVFKDDLTTACKNAFSNSWFDLSDDEYLKLALLLKNHSDWFEEIKDKDYEILEWYLPEEKSPTSKIKSVKRLSDGEVFSVGDKITVSHSDSDTYTVECFWISPAGTCFINGSKEEFISGKVDSIHITRAKKEEGPILTTEDGVDIYIPGESIYYVWEDREVSSNKYHADYARKWQEDEYKWFYSQENAKKYIQENKPQYSKKDMIEFGRFYQNEFDDESGDFVSSSFDRWLKERG